MGCNPICKFCEHADITRETDDLIRCLKRHMFVAPTGTCELHSFHHMMEDSFIEDLMKEVLEKGGKNK